MKKWALLTVFQATFLLNLTILDSNTSLRRVLKPSQANPMANNWTAVEIEEYRIIRLLDRLDNGTFNSNGQRDLIDAYNSTLEFLANPEIPWKMKNNILTRINVLSILLPQELKTVFIQRLKELDRLEFERQKIEALSKMDSTPITIYASHLPAFSLSTNIIIQNATLRSLDQRPYSRYLDNWTPNR